MFRKYEVTYCNICTIGGGGENEPRLDTHKKKIIVWYVFKLRLDQNVIPDTALCLQLYIVFMGSYNNVLTIVHV